MSCSVMINTDKHISDFCADNFISESRALFLRVMMICAVSGGMSVCGILTCYLVCVNIFITELKINTKFMIKKLK